MRVHCRLLILGLGLHTAASHAFTLTPMSTTLGPRGSESAKTFRVENDSSNRVAFQITMLTRDMDESGMETNRPAADLFTLFPPQGTIAPGKGQTVRLVWKGPANPSRELAFRLVAEELPVNFALEKNKAQIKVLVRYMAAIYVRPRNAKPNLQVASFTRSETNTYVMLAANAGTAHQPLKDLVLSLTDAQGRKSDVPVDALGPVAGQNVLAGSTRRFVLTLPGEFKEPTYQAHLTANE
jgi:fimbrial chaperone protein